MLEIKGKHNTAKVFTDKLEDTARVQIKTICDADYLKNTKIRIMPDVHAGAGCTIGTTMTITDCVIPNLVGVDIGCGMEVIRIAETELDLPKLDEIIRKYIPCGKEVQEGAIVRFPRLQLLKCYRELKVSRFERAIGTLGGGNHFIEVNKADDGSLYVVVHSGSRNLGKQVAEHYQNLAYELMKGKEELFVNRDRIIKEFKEQGRKDEIQAELKKLACAFKETIPTVPMELAYLSGKYCDMYIHDMKICQEYASLNRKTMLSIIVEKMNITVVEQFTTIHNYIDTDAMILRKGAVSAKQNEKLLIPMNMRDGSLICVGKGNHDWNNSAPHGAGRLMSRKDARLMLNMQNYIKAMEGIFTTSVCAETIDEAPDAYKPIAEILSHVHDTVSVLCTIKPIYNFKASD